jgi:hypothetical protein
MTSIGKVIPPRAVPLRTETVGKPILIIENPKEHGSPVFHQIEYGLGVMLKREVVLANTSVEALAALSVKEFDLVVVHHYDFSVVDSIRSRYPRTKVAAYSANIIDHFESGTLGEELDLRMREKYDFMLNARSGITEQIEDTLRKIDPTAYPLTC